MRIMHFVAAMAVCIGMTDSVLAQKGDVQIEVNGELVSRFARLALDCVHREYPNKIGHVLNSAKDARTPSSLHPVFYGCFDWHSSVHGHWMLVRLLRTVPDAQFAPDLREQIIKALGQSFTPSGVAVEVEYFQEENRKSYERPYGDRLVFTTHRGTTGMAGPAG